MFISVIIATKDRPCDLKACLSSLYKQVVAVGEIIIIDSSKDGAVTQKMLDGFLSRGQITIKYKHTSPGLPYQRNMGISLLDPRSEYVFFFDDDVLLFEDTLRSIIDKFIEYPDVFGIQGIEVNRKPQNILGRMARRFFFIAHEHSRWLILPSGENTIVINPSADIYVGGLMVGISGFRRRVLEEYKFDEWFKDYAYLEDLDFSFRVAQRYHLLQTPAAKFIHNRSSLSRQSIFRDSKMYIINKTYFFKKNLRHDLITLLCFLWSLVGHFIFSLGKSVYKLDFSYFRGTISGVREIVLTRFLRYFPKVP